MQHTATDRTRLGWAAVAIAAMVFGVLALHFPAERHGDGIFYFATLKALVWDHTPALSQDVQDEVAARFFPLPRELTIEADGQLYDAHFFAYSLLCVPAYLLLERFGLDTLQAFQLTNALILTLLTWYLLVRCTGPPLVRRGALALFLLSTGMFYFRWPHPEVFTAAALLASAVTFLERRYPEAALLSGIASLQNPSAAAVIAIAGTALAFDLAQRSSPRRLRRVAGFAAAAGVALIPYLWSLVTFGRLNAVVARGFIDYSLISPGRFLSLFLDLNQGVIVGLPFLLVTGVALVVLRAARLRDLRPAHEDWLVVAVVLMALPVLAQRNWNSGASVFMRYASWIAMPLIPWALASLDRFSRTVRIAIVVPAVCVQLALVWWAGGYSVDEEKDSFSFKPWVTALWTVAPTLYNPVPEIFYERSTHREGFPGIASYTTEPGRFRKVLIRERDLRLLRPLLCGQAMLLNERPDREIKIARAERGFLYFNGPLRCASSDERAQ